MRPSKRLRVRARLSGSEGAGTPLTRTLPEVGGIVSPSTPSSVDLPHPEGPMTATDSDWPMASDTESSAWTG